VCLSLADALHRRPCGGGQFVAHSTALPCDPYDDHPPATFIPATQAIIGNTLDRHRRCRMPAATTDRPSTSSKSTYARHETTTAVEPVIDHLKHDHRMGRNYLAYSSMPSTVHSPPSEQMKFCRL
jgi:IS5 family transposase